MQSIVDHPMAKALKRQADSCMAAGDYDDAIELYTTALATNAGGDGAATHANRCLAFLKLQNVSAAVQDAQAAVKLRPRWPKAHLWLGQAAEAAGNCEAAAAAYRRAAELDGGLAEAAAALLAAVEKKASQQLCRAVLQPQGGAVYAAAVREQKLHLGSVATHLIATACASGELSLWCSVSSARLQTLVGHTDSATVLAWSTCGSLLASGSLDHTARLWRVDVDLPSEPAAPLSQHGGLLRLLHPLATLAGHTGRISAVQFSPDSSRLATASVDGTLRLWCSAEGSCLLELRGHAGIVTAATFSPCGQLLASASGDTHCRVWSVASGECLHDIAWESGGVSLCRFAAAGACNDPAPRAADTQQAAASPAAQGPPDERASPAAAPAFYLVTCHIQPQRQEGRLLLWDLHRRQQGWVDGKLCAPCTTIDGLRGQCTSLDCRPTPGAGLLLAVASADGLLRMYELLPRAMPLQRPAGPAAAKELAASACQPPELQAVRLFEVPLEHSGPQHVPWSLPAWSTAAMQQAAHARNQVCLSPGGGLLAASGPDYSIRVLDVESGEEVRRLRGHSKAVRALQWLSDRDVLSAAEDGAARIWRLPACSSEHAAVSSDQP